MLEKISLEIILSWKISTKIISNTNVQKHTYKNDFHPYRNKKKFLHDTIVASYDQVVNNSNVELPLKNRWILFM